MNVNRREMLAATAMAIAAPGRMLAGEPTVAPSPTAKATEDKWWQVSVNSNGTQSLPFWCHASSPREAMKTALERHPPYRHWEYTNTYMVNESDPETPIAFECRGRNSRSIHWLHVTEVSGQVDLESGNIEIQWKGAPVTVLRYPVDSVIPF